MSSPPVLHRLRHASRLPVRELARGVEATVLFHACRAALRLVAVRRLRPLFGTPGPPDRGPDGDVPLASRPGATPAQALALRRALRRAARSRPDTCLAQALAGRLMLRRRGLASSLSLGARDGDDGFAFHAWLRSGGVLLNDGGSPRRHAVLTTFYDPPVETAADADARPESTPPT